MLNPSVKRRILREVVANHLKGEEEVSMEGVFDIVKRFFKGGAVSKTLKQDRQKYWKDNVGHYLKVIELAKETVTKSTSDEYTLNLKRISGLVPSNGKDFDLAYLTSFFEDYYSTRDAYVRLYDFFIAEMVKLAKKKHITEADIKAAGSRVTQEGIKVIDIKEKATFSSKHGGQRYKLIGNSPDLADVPYVSGNPDVYWGIDAWKQRSKVTEMSPAKLSKDEMLKTLSLLEKLIKAVIIEPCDSFNKIDKLSSTVGFTVASSEDIITDDEWDESSNPIKDRFLTWDDYFYYISCFDPSDDAGLDEWWLSTDIDFIDAIIEPVATAIDTFR